MGVIRSPMEDSLEDDVRRTVEGMGYEFVGMELVRRSSLLRVYVDVAGGVTLKDCELVSKALSRMLDERYEDLFADRYYLEVSSPGLDRPLFRREDYERFLGREVRVKRRGSAGRQQVLSGVLRSVDDEGVLLETEGGPLRVLWRDLIRANLAGGTS